MAKPLIEVALKLTGHGVTPEKITNAIQLTPTKSWTIGDSIGKTIRKHKCTGWIFGLPRREAYEMGELLRELLDTLELHMDKIISARKQFRLEVEISFGVYIGDEMPAGWFDADLIRRVAIIEASLDIDLIPYGI